MQWTCCLCLGEWPTPRSLCPACGRGGSRRISHYSAAGMELLQVQACEPCKIYVHIVDASRDPAAIADVDELTALPLDVWAQGQGYRKLQPNLLGI